MSCPLNKNRWKGSGYDKKGPECSTALDSQMNDMLAAREAMDKAIALPHPLFTTAPTPVGPPKPQVVPNMFQVAQQASKAVAQFAPQPVQRSQQSISIPMDADAMPCSLCVCKDFFPDRGNRTLCVGCRHPYNNHHPIKAGQGGPPIPPGPPALTRTVTRGPPTLQSDLKIAAPRQQQNHGTYHRY
jgi:hypothetical protein